VRHLIDLAAEDPTARIEIDVRAQRARGDGFAYGFELDPFIKECLVEGLDEISLVERHTEAIAGFESTRAPWLPAVR
jgi:3-isopropylmalate/(R)-2-methylmalate dehydratase small subunit